MIAGLVARFITPYMWYVVLAAFVAGSIGTYKVMDWKHDAELAQAVKVAMALQTDQFKTVIKVETRVQEKIRVIEKKGNDIIREVPVYVTRETDAAYPMPNGLVRLHDAAAKGEPPGPAAVTDASPSGVIASDVARTVGTNYKEYLACRQQVIEWNAFYSELKQRSERK